MKTATGRACTTTPPISAMPPRRSCWAPTPIREQEAPRRGRFGRGIPLRPNLSCRTQGTVVALSVFVSGDRFSGGVRAFAAQGAELGDFLRGDGSSVCGDGRCTLPGSVAGPTVAELSVGIDGGR